MPALRLTLISLVQSVVTPNIFICSLYNYPIRRQFEERIAISSLGSTMTHEALTRGL